MARVENREDGRRSKGSEWNAARMEKEQRWDKQLRRLFGQRMVYRHGINNQVKGKSCLSEEWNMDMG